MPHRHHRKVYAQYIRTFAFGRPELPIVQPGADIPIPERIAKQGEIEYIATPRPGFVVPRGTYQVQVAMFPGAPASVALLVNGQKPVSLESGFPYTERNVSADDLARLVMYTATVKASRSRNFLSLRNIGSSLITLGTLPGARSGNQGELVSIVIQKVA